jgi:hypothetical protein
MQMLGKNEEPLVEKTVPRENYNAYLPGDGGNRRNRRLAARADRLGRKDEARLLRLLKAQDVRGIQRWYAETNKGVIEDRVAMLSMHKARIEHAQTTEEEKELSRKWFSDQGLNW